MQRSAALLAAAVSLAPLAATAANPHSYVNIAFTHPHRPLIESADARALFDGVNAARAARGLSPLAWDGRLSAIALSLARQMAERRYFGHTDPDGVTFEDRLRSFNYRYTFAAENIALDSDVEHAHEALLHSPGHYANIVDPHPSKLGVAALSAGEGQTLYVEEFSD